MRDHDPPPPHPWDRLPLPAGVRRAFRLAVGPRRAARDVVRDAARDVDDEIAFHLAMREQKLRAAGLSDTEARAAARARFGDVSRVADACLAESVARSRVHARAELAASVRQDVRLALRALRRAPLASAAVLLTLTVGIGATAAAFALVYDVLLRPLPVDRPDRLVFLWDHLPARGAERVPVAAPDVAVVAGHARELESVAFTNRVADVTWSHDGVADRLRVAAVTANYFATLGARPALGRTFRPGEGLLPPDFPAGAPLPEGAVVVSDALWRARFGADPAVLGRRLTLNGRPAVVVGVMPPGFAVPFPPGSGFAATADAWVPLRRELAQLRRPDGFVEQDTDNSGAAVARLRPGATLASVAGELARLSAELPRDARVPRDPAARLVAAPLAADGVRHVRPALVTLLVAGVLLNLVACLNVGGALLARLLARARELAVRSALGAGRGRLARQVLAEVAVHAALGMAGGAALAVLGTRAALRLRPAALPRVDDAPLAPPALFAALAGAALTVLVVGLVAARRAAAIAEGESHALGARGVAADRGRLRRALATAQVALAVVLAVGCGLVMRSAARLGTLDPGFRAEGAVAFDLTVRGEPGYSNAGATARTALVAALEARLRAVPGVVAVGVVNRVPLGERRWTNAFWLDGDPPESRGTNAADFRMVSSDYFRAVGTRVVRGRAFTADEDRFERSRVVIVDEVLARRIAPGGGGDPARAVGQRLNFPLDGRPASAEVVGVVEPVRFASLWQAPRGAFYVPYRQEASRDLSLVVRTAGDPAALAASLPRLVREVEPRLPVYNARPMTAYVGDSTATVRFALAVLTGFAGAAIALALFGVLVTLSHDVARRRREIGVRLTLGATRAQVTAAVLRSGGAVVAAGTAAGVALALVAGRGLRALLFEVSPSDPLVLAAVAAAVALTGVAAVALPARRAARTDPMTCIRAD